MHLSITGGLLDSVYFYSVLSLLTITLSNFATGDRIRVLPFLASIQRDNVSLRLN